MPIVGSWYDGSIREALGKIVLTGSSIIDGSSFINSNRISDRNSKLCPYLCRGCNQRRIYYRKYYYRSCWRCICRWSFAFGFHWIQSSVCWSTCCKRDWSLFSIQQCFWSCWFCCYKRIRSCWARRRISNGFRLTRPPIRQANRVYRKIKGCAIR
jgi:hypothetical protein